MIGGPRTPRSCLANFQPVVVGDLEPGLDEFLMQPYVEAILNLLNAKVPEKDGKPGCHLVILSFEAQESRRQWHNAVEMRMAEGRDLADVRDIASHAVSNTVKIAMVLHLLERPHLLNEEESELDLETWERAKKIGEYHLAEAVRIQRLADRMALESSALQVIRWALDSSTMEFTIQTLVRTGPRPRMCSRDAEAVMEFMIKLNWARKLPPGHGDRSTRYAVNPKCRQIVSVARVDGGK